MERRKFLWGSLIGSGALLSNAIVNQGWAQSTRKKKLPPFMTGLVISTWNAGLTANEHAWKSLLEGGKALDMVEKGVNAIEADFTNRYVGLGGLPDREGHTTLDACIMDSNGMAGSVMCVEQVKYPSSLARLVMERTPHVQLVGEGAQQFAVEQGIQLDNFVSDEAQKMYEEWLQKSEYKPIINAENHDTIGLLAIDLQGDLAGVCTTSGMAYKMRGRVGDSPIIGAGLYVDNEIGAATATGLGEAVVRTCGSFLVVELMRQGMDPQRACESAVERIRSKHTNVKDFQVGFLAVNKAGEVGAFSVQPGFTYALHKNGINQIFNAPSMFK
jgi:isoaspartyl peptidase/L-asparaginase-like protein (Ntn-hydrolase superfamily)